MKPLTLINTRAAHQLTPLSQAVSDFGGRSLEVPLIRIEAISSAQLPKLQTGDWLVFTSVNSVTYWKQHSSVKEGIFIACVGEKTKAAAAAAGYHIDIMPDTYDAESLAEVLLERAEPGARIIYPRSAKSRSVLKEHLEAQRRIVLDPVIYDTVPNESSRSALNEALDSADGVLLLSPSAVHAFFQFAAPEKVPHVFFGCIGTVTEKSCRRYTDQEILVPDTYTIESLLTKIMKEKVKL